MIFCHFPEHRFYGLSNPKPDLSVASLQLHTLAQAVEDLVYFAENVQLAMPGGNNVQPGKAPWVLIGGSYAGALTAWTMTRSVYHFAHTQNLVLTPSFLAANRVYSGPVMRPQELSKPSLTSGSTSSLSGRTCPRTAAQMLRLSLRMSTKFSLLGRPRKSPR